MRQLIKNVIAMPAAMAVSFLLLVSVPVLQTEANAADHTDGTMKYSGLHHSATGEAALGTQLVISNIGSTGEDGVTISLGASSGWSAGAFSVIPTSLDWTTTFTATGKRDHQRVSPSLAIKERSRRSDGRILIGYAPSFGDASYRVEIYDGSTLVHNSLSLPPGSESTFSGNDPICDLFGKSQSVAAGICEWVAAPSFEQNDNGECEWDISGVRKMFIMNDGTEVSGTRIRFVENLSSAPQKAIFSSMSIQGSDLELMSIDHEHVQRPSKR